MMNKLNKYEVSMIRPMTITVEVEAFTDVEAMRKALEIANSGAVLTWQENCIQTTGAQLVAYADRDAEKLEAMLNVLRNNGFEVEEKHTYFNRVPKLVGYEITSKTPETEMFMLHEVDCSEYAEGLTADNFFAEWKADVNRFDPAWEVAEVIQDLELADAAKCLRDMLEDCDAYAYHLRAVTAKMQKAMLEFDKKEDVE